MGACTRCWPEGGGIAAAEPCAMNVTFVLGLLLYVVDHQKRLCLAWWRAATVLQLFDGVANTRAISCTLQHQTAEVPVPQRYTPHLLRGLACRLQQLGFPRSCAPACMHVRTTAALNI